MYLNPYVMRDWALMNVKNPKQKRELLSAIARFFECAKRSAITVTDLGPIFAVSRSAITNHREVGVQLLLLLGMHHAAAREVLFGLLSEKSAEVRFSMVAHFGYWHLPYPTDFILKVVAKAIDDISAKVRSKAADTCYGYYKVKENLPALTSRLAKETNAKVKDNIEFNIAIVRDGYQVKQGADGSYYLSVRTDDGLSLVHLADKDRAPKRLKRLVNKIRADKSNTCSAVIG
jgi:hypothetical protein